MASERRWTCRRGIRENKGSQSRASQLFERARTEAEATSRSGEEEISQERHRWVGKISRLIGRSRGPASPSEERHVRIFSLLPSLSPHCFFWASTFSNHRRQESRLSAQSRSDGRLPSYPNMAGDIPAASCTIAFPWRACIWPAISPTGWSQRQCYVCADARGMPERERELTDGCEIAFKSYRTNGWVGKWIGAEGEGRLHRLTEMEKFSLMKANFAEQ